MRRSVENKEAMLESKTLAIGESKQQIGQGQPPLQYSDHSA
jgi:hypothetical protein